MTVIEFPGVAALTEAEMAQTDGGVVPFVAGLIVGAAFGGGVVTGVGLVYAVSKLY